MDQTREMIEQVINEKIKALFANHFANGALVALISAWAFSWTFALPPVLLALAFKIAWDAATHKDIFPFELVKFAAGAAVPFIAISL